VLGGAGIALFGMVVAAGVRTLVKVHFTNTNVLVVAIAVGIALLPTVQPEIYANFPSWFQLIFDSGISAGAIAAILLNLLLNRDQLNDDHVAAGHHARSIPKSLSRPDEVRRAEAAREARRADREVLADDRGDPDR
jgi:NCS2 family nucleobase:cation symporter-2